MKKYHVYGLGAALVDTEIQVSDADLEEMGVTKGQMTLVDEAKQNSMLTHLSDHMVHAKRASGGSAANSIIAANYFGASNFYCCKVAGDENGKFYINDLNNAGVASNPHAENTEGTTGKCLVLITDDAERSMNTFLGASETLSREDLNLAAISDSDYLYIEGYLVTSPAGKAAAIAAKKHAEDTGVKTSLSFSDPGIVEFFKNGIDDILGDGVDLVFCNEAEAKSWAKTAHLDEAIAALKTKAKQFAITRGAEGAVIFDGTQLIDISAFKVDAVDSNGAGDMFAGAFLYAITAGKSYAYAGALASKASATVVTHYGPRLAANEHQRILAEVENS